MSWSDYHVHTCFSDGRDTPEQVAAAASARGMKALGFSDHSAAPYEADFYLRPERAPSYFSTCRALRKQYAGRMEIWCGIEQDFFSETPTDGYDYVIGSVHDLYIRGEYLTVDWEPEHLERAAALLGGDMLAVTEEYFRLVARVVEKTGCQLIGHFDLVAKLNERSGFFDERAPRYIAAWQRAADELLKTGVPFEINTGAISRGYRTEAYPSPPILRYLAERGARFVLSSDAHRLDNLCYDFKRQEELCARLGVKLLDRLAWQTAADASASPSA